MQQTMTCFSMTYLSHTTLISRTKKHFPFEPKQQKPSFLIFYPLSLHSRCTWPCPKTRAQGQHPKLVKTLLTQVITHMLACQLRCLFLRPYLSAISGSPDQQSLKRGKKLLRIRLGKCSSNQAWLPKLQCELKVSCTSGNRWSYTQKVDKDYKAQGLSLLMKSEQARVQVRSWVPLDCDVRSHMHCTLVAGLKGS